ncbi:hypothetical protein ACFP2T_27655 [Plantactinospora solaniradicis]|uniref:Phosphoribulokinase/uridine kinase domain-containing protein n=1 Tax=Plantactinospora solaniradicis TaxID=1723736 RepID=A0ABW1KDV5_9ACTN
MLLTLTGGAGAGKTTLAAALAAQRGAITVLHLDDYYHLAEPERGVWLPDETGTPRLDVGDPCSIDFARLNGDAATALATSAVVIAEGLFAIQANPSVPHTRFDVFVDLAADLRLARKIQRKCVREGFPVEILITNYLNHRRDAYDRYTEPARHRSDLVINAELPADLLATQIWRAITEQSIHNS